MSKVKVNDEVTFACGGNAFVEMIESSKPYTDSFTCYRVRFMGFDSDWWYNSSGSGLAAERRASPLAIVGVRKSNCAPDSVRKTSPSSMSGIFERIADLLRKDGL